MNNLWSKSGKDMRMCLYDCISTGDQRGLIQVVPGATTIGKILLQATDNDTFLTNEKQNNFVTNNKTNVNKSNKANNISSIFRKISSAKKALNDKSVIALWLLDQIQIKRKIHHSLKSQYVYDEDDEEQIMNDEFDTYVFL